MTKRKEAGPTLKQYEYWKVRPEYDNGDTPEWRKIEELIAIVSLEPRHADALNEHSHNTGFRYFPVS